MAIKIMAAHRLKASGKLQQELAELEKRYKELQKRIKDTNEEDIDGKDLEQLRKLSDTIKRTRESLG